MSIRKRDVSAKRMLLAVRLATLLPEAIDASLRHMLSSVADGSDRYDSRYVAGWREAIGACLECGLAAIEQGGEWTAQIPPVAVAQARRASRDGVELSVVLEYYRAAYQAAWDFVLNEITVSNLSQMDSALVLCEVSLATTSLLARVLVEVARAHAEESDQARRSLKRRREEVVRMVLAGRRMTHAEVDYDFQAWHVGVIAGGTGATAALELLAQRAGRGLLVVEQDDGTAWGWMSGRTPLRARDLLALAIDTGARHVGVSFSAGLPARDWPGFARTHRLALAAWSVAERWPQRVTLYEDVQLLAHALQHDDYATSLIETYIVPLEFERDGQSLRRTLEVFYRTEHNRELAARQLNVGRHTLQRHLARVGTLIGRSLDAHHSEMKAALKLSEPRSDDCSNEIALATPPVNPE